MPNETIADPKSDEVAYECLEHGEYESMCPKCLFRGGDGYNAPVAWDDKRTGWHPFGSYEGAEWDKSVEVIGNIYENPELTSNPI